MEKIEAIDLEVRKPKEKKELLRLHLGAFGTTWVESHRGQSESSHQPVLLSSPFSATEIFALLKIHLLFSSPHRQLRATVVITIVQLAHVSSNFLYYPGSWHIDKGCNLCLMSGDINLFG